ncbi:hypothetical protein NC653_010059 [Populus alba x Populus x berolinensis]|uniref:Uncharacterized protein n=1 Tax=Populus alba x Populus x berolinensis TaxID=444605 RepID=A0AAD6W5A6_9ROSI|nr:hypothetical protein NC653_010059 [Populus alba x Populus x berolinensis]
MVSRSYTNLLDLASGNFPAMGQPRERKQLPRVMTVPGVISELDDDAVSDVPSSVVQDRMIIVANQMPVKAKRRPDNKGWSFSWDEDSLLLHLKDGLPEDMEVLYVGSLRADVDLSEQDDVSQVLLDRLIVFRHFYLLIFCQSFIMGFVNSICGRFFTICFLFRGIMLGDLIDLCGRHMWQQIRSSRIR